MAGPFFSTQLTNVNAQTVLQPGQGGGDSFIIPFDYTTAGGGGPAIGEIVYLCNIPEGLYVERHCHRFSIGLHDYFDLDYLS
jgi:hypothetical protein